MMEVRWQDEPVTPVAPPAFRSMKSEALAVAQRYGLTLDDLKGPARRHEIAHPRQEAMARIYAIGRFSTPQIGMFLGGRDHSTVIFGIRRHAERVAAGEVAE